MARLLRLEYPGAIYHVTCRMVGERVPAGGYGEEGWPKEKRLFRDARDYWRFWDDLGERVEHFHIRLYLFVCMTNHIHLVFETPEANLSPFMQSLNTAYTVYYNRRHGRHGHLLDGRYQARLVEGDDYLLALSRYVHLNPVHVAPHREKPLSERVSVLHDYRWSSYRSYVGESKPIAWVNYEPVLAMISGRGAESVEQYREFVQSGLARDDDEFAVILNASRHCIGGEAFRVRTAARYEERVAACGRPDDASFRRMGEPLPAEAVLALLGETLGVEVAAFKRRCRNSALRGFAAHGLTRYAGLSQRETADVLHIGGAAVSNQLASLSGKLERSSDLRRQFKRVDRRLKKAWAHRDGEI